MTISSVVLSYYIEETVDAPSTFQIHKIAYRIGGCHEHNYSMEHCKCLAVFRRHVLRRRRINLYNVIQICLQPSNVDGIPQVYYDETLRA